MIWRTSLGRWHDRYGTWHAWFAWHPVTLENPTTDDGPRRSRAWLCRVARIGVVVRDRPFWLYAPAELIGLERAGAPPAADNVVPLRKARR